VVTQNFVEEGVLVIMMRVKGVSERHSGFRQLLNTRQRRNADFKILVGLIWEKN
jgi:hypothetical protein